MWNIINGVTQTRSFLIVSLSKNSLIHVFKTNAHVTRMSRHAHILISRLLYPGLETTDKFT